MEEPAVGEEEVVGEEAVRAAREAALERKYGRITQRLRIPAKPGLFSLRGSRPLLDKSSPIVARVVPRAAEREAVDSDGEGAEGEEEEPAEDGDGYGPRASERDAAAAAAQKSYFGYVPVLEGGAASQRERDLAPEAKLASERSQVRVLPDGLIAIPQREYEALARARKQLHRARRHLLSQQTLLEEFASTVSVMERRLAEQAEQLDAAATETRSAQDGRAAAAADAEREQRARLEAEEERDRLRRQLAETAEELRFAKAKGATSGAVSPSVRRLRGSLQDLSGGSSDSMTAFGVDADAPRAKGHPAGLRGAQSSATLAHADSSAELEADDRRMPLQGSALLSESALEALKNRRRNVRREAAASTGDGDGDQPPGQSPFLLAPSLRRLLAVDLRPAGSVASDDTASDEEAGGDSDGASVGEDRAGRKDRRSMRARMHRLRRQNDSL